jgi:uncharacterized protein YaaN involved in tellurite resistance
MAALKHAVAVALVLGARRNVLRQTTMLSETTSQLVERGAEMLADQTQHIYDQAAKPRLSIESLGRSFDKVYGALDYAENARARSLSTMRGTIVELQGMIDGAKQYLNTLNPGDIPAHTPLGHHPDSA